MSIKLLLLGGGGYFGFWAGGGRFYFYGREDFSEDGSEEACGGPLEALKEFDPLPPTLSVSP